MLILFTCNNDINGFVGIGGGCVCVGAKGGWDLSVSSARFCCEPKLL